MSANIKKAGRIGTKIVAAFLFLFLVMFNLEVGLYDGEGSDNGILGLTMSVFVPGVFAGGGSNPGDCDADCGGTGLSCKNVSGCATNRSCGTTGYPLACHLYCDDGNPEPIECGFQ